MRTNVLVVISVALATCMGCATQFMGSAPAAAAGSTYVAGSDSNNATIWICEANKECTNVDISE